jgi:hypothetical protein
MLHVAKYLVHEEENTTYRSVKCIPPHIQVLPEVVLNQDNITDFVELLLGIGFLSLESYLHFRVHHQVSVDASGGQQTS